MSTWWSASPFLFAESANGDDSSHPEHTPEPRQRDFLRLATSDAASDNLPSADAALATRVRAGDRAAVRELFDTYFVTLLGHVQSIVKARPAAEDIVADVFVSILEHPERVTPTRSLRAYLLWRVRHRALDVLRGERRTDARNAVVAREQDSTISDIPGDLFDAATLGDPRAQRMMTALATLTPTARTIVLLRLRDELEYDEIALVLGISRSAVKMRLSRALAAIRARLE